MRAATIEADRRAARAWLALAVGSLVLAGLFAIFVAFARVPPLDRIAGDPLVFRRLLVVHVDLALVVWFYAFLAGLFFIIPGARPNTISRHGVAVAFVGVVVLVAGAVVPGAEPLLANYVPLIDHPLFAGGLVLVAAGVALTFLDGRLLPRHEIEVGWFEAPACARVALRGAAIAFLVALITFGAGLRATPAGLERQTHFELAFWGGGHVLQLANVAGMLAVWLILVGRATDRAPLSRSFATALFALLVLPALAGPLLAARGTARAGTRDGFTWMMELGIFPIVLVVLGACVRTLVRARVGLGDRRVRAFAASATLALVGFALGAAIDGSNTVVPAHYHASIGAVTVAYMGASYLLVPVAERRLAAWQPLLFGAGQTVFAVGFAIAGAHGMARKTFGAEQHARTPAQTVGLVVMGVGGLVAVAGGVLFLYVLVKALARARREKVSWLMNGIGSRG
jgi:hypothetical protein